MLKRETGAAGQSHQQRISMVMGLRLLLLVPLLQTKMAATLVKVIYYINQRVIP